MQKKINQSLFKNAPYYIKSASIHSNGEVWGSSWHKCNLELNSFYDGSQGFSGGRMVLLATNFNADNWKTSAVDRVFEVAA